MAASLEFKAFDATTCEIPPDDQEGANGSTGPDGAQGSAAPQRPKAIQDLPPRPPGRNTKCTCGCGKKVKHCPNKTT